MKNLITVTMFLFAFAFTNAQWKKDGSADMRYKSNREVYTLPKSNTDYSPDMRYESNKQTYGSTRLYRYEDY